MLKNNYEINFGGDTEVPRKDSKGPQRKHETTNLLFELQVDAQSKIFDTSHFESRTELNGKIEYEKAEDISLGDLSQNSVSTYDISSTNDESGDSSKELSGNCEDILHFSDSHHSLRDHSSQKGSSQSL